MKTETADKIIELSRKTGGIRPSELVRELGISNSAVHRQLRKLVEKELLRKQGRPPYVVYLATEEKGHTENKKPETSLSGLSPEIFKIIESSFCYFLPNGKMLEGAEAFVTFLNKTSQHALPLDRAKEYEEVFLKAESFRLGSGAISGLKKIQTTFTDCCLEEMYYADFYSLPKFGKTKLGQYLLHGKSGQNKLLIKKITNQVAPLILEIIKKHKIDSVAYVPHSIPRKVPFLSEFKKVLNLTLPEIRLSKAYSGEVPIAQKSLSKLAERVDNARETIFLVDREVEKRRVLLIDDALGSGATINETAKKIISAGAKEICGFVVTGSYKGFEVIKEV